MINTSKLTFFTGVSTVTGANFLLDTGVSKILIDCGMVQGDAFATKENEKPFGFDINSIDALIITHAHLDHVGRIPKLVKEGYQGPIYSTPETKELAELVLTDAVSILAMDAKRNGTTPIYDSEDVQAVFPLWKTIPYHEQTSLLDDISIFLKDAGHILGSAMVEVSVIPTSAVIPAQVIQQNRAWPGIQGHATDSNTEDIKNDNSFKGKTLDSNLRWNDKVGYRNDKTKFGNEKTQSTLKILFTGDVGNSPAPLLRDTEDVGDVDYMVMESVYGDRNHETREKRLEQFTQVINETLEKGGTLVIPAFSIDRTQLLLYELNNLVEQKKIPSVPVFVDSPMAIKATQVYQSNTRLFNDAVQKQISGGDNIFDFPHLQFTVSQNESRDIERLKGAKIILAGSGMSVGGRVVKHEADYLPDPKNTILLVGYQTNGSLGRRLADGAKKVTIQGQEIKIKARIETLYGYSAHKDSDHLVDFVATATPRLKQVFVVMGEPNAALHLTQRLNNEINVKAVAPAMAKGYELK